MKRVTEIEIVGKKFPLCFTVGAAKEFREAFGLSIKNIDQVLNMGDDGEKVDVVLVNMLQILRIALDGGRAAVQCNARMEGQEVPEIPTLTLDDLLSLYTMADVQPISQEIMHCLALSSGREVESVPAKNAEAAASAGKKSA